MKLCDIFSACLGQQGELPENPQQNLFDKLPPNTVLDFNLEECWGLSQKHRPTWQVTANTYAQVFYLFFMKKKKGQVTNLPYRYVKGIGTYSVGLEPTGQGCGRASLPSRFQLVLHTYRVGLLPTHFLGQSFVQVKYLPGRSHSQDFTYSEEVPGKIPMYRYLLEPTGQVCVFGTGPCLSLLLLPIQDLILFLPFN